MNNLIKKAFALSIGALTVAGSIECSAESTNQGGYLKTDIRDLVLIYQGGVQRMDFNADQLRPYVVHENRHGGRDWLFDGFLFLEFDSGRGVSFEKRANAPLSKKEDWLWLIDRHFAPGKGIPALDECIEQEIARIGKPSFKHKVVIGLPEPPLGQTDWGEIDGQQLDFNNDADRATACKWYIDSLVSRFNAGKFNNIELSGFYWMSEKALQSRPVTTVVGDYIHSMDKLFYWIPYYTAQGYSEWKQSGFDAAYIQPSYFWDRPTIKEDRLDRTCELAHTYHMGVEMEFDMRASVDDKNCSRDRGLKYMTSFRKNGVYRDASIAYYEGGAGMYHFTRKTDPRDREFIDTLAWFIIDRRHRMLEGQNPDFIARFNDKQLNSDDWNTTGDVKVKKNKLLMSGNSSADTRFKHDFKYGTVKARIKINPKAGDSKFTLRLLPTNEKLGPLPKSGELFLLKYDALKPGELACGAQTMQMNDELNNIKRSVLTDDNAAGRVIDLECKWTERDVVFKIDGVTANIQEDLYDSTKPYYPQGWPFNFDTFYLQMSTEGRDGQPVAEILSVEILPD